jgi:hypothetical protein
VDVSRWRRPGADEILLAYLLLEVAGWAVSWRSHAGSAPQNPLESFVITAFLTWRVSRGGRISRVLLILGSLASCAVAVLAVARMWDGAVAALVVIGATQVVLIGSPPVYGRTRRPAPVADRAESWMRLVRRPPGWLLPWGLLAGLLLTLALLGNETWAAIPGCYPAGSDACFGLVRGYPLRWITAGQGVSDISPDALLRDWVQWGLACTSVLYLLLSWPTVPAAPAISHEAEDEESREYAQQDSDDGWQLVDYHGGAIAEGGADEDDDESRSR